MQWISKILAENGSKMAKNAKKSDFSRKMGQKTILLEVFEVFAPQQPYAPDPIFHFPRGSPGKMTIFAQKPRFLAKFHRASLRNCLFLAKMGQNEQKMVFFDHLWGLSIS